MNVRFNGVKLLILLFFNVLEATPDQLEQLASALKVLAQQSSVIEQPISGIKKELLFVDELLNGLKDKTKNLQQVYDKWADDHLLYKNYGHANEYLGRFQDIRYHYFNYGLPSDFAIKHDKDKNKAEAEKDYKEFKEVWDAMGRVVDGVKAAGVTGVASIGALDANGELAWALNHMNTIFQFEPGKTY